MTEKNESFFFTPIRTLKEEKPGTPLRGRLFDIIFEADTPAGKAFDVILLILIFLSIVAVMLESVSSIRAEYRLYLYTAEWIFTFLFTIEYFFRLACVLHPGRYALSFFGLVDLLAVIPTYLSLFVTGAQTLLVIRIIRLLRIFRIFKLTRYVGESRILVTALKTSYHKIVVFLGAVLSIVVIIGALMYLVEGPENGFTSIPESVYWAIVTMTTVGYGDIAPKTFPGRALAAFVMILGYAIIAVPTGVVSVELARATRLHAPLSRRRCSICMLNQHEADAVYCRRCGGPLPAPVAPDIGDTVPQDCWED
jgi:voltage-gated potassium channel